MSDVVVARTVEMFSCWCGEHFLTMSSYAKHVNLHARGEYKHAEVDEMKQENSRGFRPMKRKIVQKKNGY